MAACHVANKDGPTLIDLNTACKHNGVPNVERSSDY